MINLVKLNIVAFSRKKNYKNYININVCIFFIMFLLLCIKQYCSFQIGQMINDGNNKIININSFKTTKELEIFFEENKEKISNVNYQIINYLIKIDNAEYTVNNLEYDDNRLEFYAVSSIDSLVRELEIGKTKVTLQKSTDIPSDEIYVNQYTASYMCLNIKSINCSISFAIKNYFDIDVIFSELIKYDISGNLNENISDTIIAYKNVNSIITVLFLIMIILVIVITIVLAINFLYEEKKNIIIYNNIGCTITKLLIMYILTFLYFLSVAYFISLLILPIMYIVLIVLGDNKINKYYLIWPLLILIIINTLTVIIEISIFLKKKKN